MLQQLLTVRHILHLTKVERVLRQHCLLWLLVEQETSIFVQTLFKLHERKGLLGLDSAVELCIV